jgi:sulfatase maturation enzyme AslB (radical SAM superfamily)
MDKLRLSIKVAGCPNKCFYCHSLGGGNKRALLDVDTIIETAAFFRENISADVSVLLMEEQTYYPDFFSLITKLESSGFLRKEPTKWLISNCWGLNHVPEFIDSVSNHYSVVMPTLFGIGDTHDMHTRRQGSYDDILNASKECLRRGIEVNWNLKWSRLNTDDMNSLSELADSMRINSFINCEYYLYGYFNPKQAKKYLPVYDDLSKIRYDIYEEKQGILKTARQFVDDVKNDISYSVKTVSFDDLYVTDDLNVYPLGHTSNEYCLGNVSNSPDKLIDNISNGNNLPEAIIKKRNQDFSELVAKYADVDSVLLHTPQSLFDMLYLEHVK